MCSVCEGQDIKDTEVVRCGNPACAKVACRQCTLLKEKFWACSRCRRGPPWPREFVVDGSAMAEWLLEEIQCFKCGVWQVRGDLPFHLQRMCDRALYDTHPNKRLESREVVTPMRWLEEELSGLMLRVAEQYATSGQPADAGAIRVAVGARCAQALGHAKDRNTEHRRLSEMRWISCRRTLLRGPAICPVFGWKGWRSD